MTQTILAIDTSARASVALLAGEDILFSGESEDDRSHAEAAGALVRQALAAGAAAGHETPGAVAVGLGPGPFTGLRVGIATADSLALAWSVPLLTVPSLDALALAAARQSGRAGVSGLLAVATDARRREVYSAVYRMAGEGGDTGAGAGGDTGRGLELVTGPSVGPATECAEHVRGLAGGEPVFLAGAGIDLYDEAFRAAIPAARRLSAVRPHAADIARLAVGRAPAENISPLYLRESDAQVPGPRKKATW